MKINNRVNIRKIIILTIFLFQIVAIEALASEKINNYQMDYDDIVEISLSNNASNILAIKNDRIRKYNTYLTEGVSLVVDREEGELNIRLIDEKIHKYPLRIFSEDGKKQHLILYFEEIPGQIVTLLPNKQKDIENNVLMNSNISISQDYKETESLYSAGTEEKKSFFANLFAMDKTSVKDDQEKAHEKGSLLLENKENQMVTKEIGDVDQGLSIINYFKNDNIPEEYKEIPYQNNCKIPASLKVVSRKLYQSEQYQVSVIKVQGRVDTPSLEFKDALAYKVISAGNDFGISKVIIINSRNK